MPGLLFRETRERWKEKGSKTLIQRAEEKAKELMENRIDNGLTEDQVEALDNLVNRFLGQL